jgi:dimethylargininase
MVSPRIALVRGVSPAFARCELTHLVRAPIDVARAREQHEAYVRCLASLGCSVIALPPDEALPDCVFVEDVALAFDEVALVTRPGAVSRRPETTAVAEALASFRPLRHIEPPGTLDGGDVLRLGPDVFVGVSSRTTGGAVAQLDAILRPLGYTVRAVAVEGCLHLKTAVTQVAHDTVLLNPAWVSASQFEGWRIVEVDPAEPMAANALLVGNVVVHPAAFPLTRRRLQAAGIPIRAVDVSEIAKAEGGVTCCSLVFSGQVLWPSGSIILGNR